MVLFFFSILLLVVFGYLIQIFFSGFSLMEILVAYFLGFSAYIIFFLEIAGLIEQLNHPLTILLIQIFITTCIFLLLRKRVLKPNFRSFLNSVKNHFEIVRIFAKQHPFLLLFFGIISAGYAFLFYLSIHFPQNTTDALYNHLSRIGYWLQQGSLKPYQSFTNIGIIFPYNNSLLMLWSIVFTRQDNLVGLVQLFSTISIALTIYCLAIELGFPKRNSFISALLFLIFPIILLQSITAQNDLLAAAFISASFLFLIKSFHQKPGVFLILSTLAISLALGTKQYSLFVLPGYMLLFVTSLIQSKKDKLKTITIWAGAMLIFTLLVGSYTYIQNEVFYGSLFAESEVVNYETTSDALIHFFPKITTNSARLFSQFVSCDGLPQGFEQKCIDSKVAFFQPLFGT